MGIYYVLQKEEMQLMLKQNMEMVVDYTAESQKRREDLQRMWKAKQLELTKCSDEETLSKHISQLKEIERAKRIESTTTACDIDGQGLRIGEI